MLEKVSSARIPIRPPAMSLAIRLLDDALMPRRSCGICDSGVATNMRSVASVFGKSVRSLNSMCAVRQVMSAFPHVRNGYREIRKCRRDFLRLLTQVKAAYPEARLSDDRRGIALRGFLLIGLGERLHVAEGERYHAKGGSDGMWIVR